MLNKNSYPLLKISDLRFFCKSIHIKGVYLMKKNELFINYNQYLACKIIQTSFRKHFYKNATDCITLEPVKYPCFIYRTKTGKHFFYDYDSLIKYISKTGNTRDPMTRSEYSDIDLARLDNEVKIHRPGIKYSSTLKIKKNISYAKRIRNKENEILAFQVRLNELQEIILTFVNYNILSLVNDFQEVIVVDNVNYDSLGDYIALTLAEFKITYKTLLTLDKFSAESFKINLLESIESSNESPIYRAIETF